LDFPDKPSYENKHAAAYFNFLFTANWIELRVKQALAPYQLTHPQFNILKILNGSHPQPLSPGDIKERMLFKSPDITRLIDRLVRKNYVDRQPCPDNRRKVDLRITKEGIALLDQIFPEIKKSVKDYFVEELTEKEAEELYKLLNKMRKP